MNERKLVFFDIESTGTNVKNDRIIDISFAKNNGEQLHYRLDPEIPIPPTTSEIHGITDEMVAGCPRFREVANEILSFINNCDLAGFNCIKFDCPLLFNEFLRAGIVWDYSDINIVDVGNLFKIFNPRTLEAAYRLYVGGEFNAHNSMDDSLATMEVFYRMLDKHGLTGDSTKIALMSNYDKKILDLSGYFAYNEQDEIIFNFGKHRGERVHDHVDYLGWMSQQDFPADTKMIISSIITESTIEIF